MKELNFEKMEIIQGGVNCFLTGAWAVVSLFTPMSIFGDPVLTASLNYCWNS